MGSVGRLGVLLGVAALGLAACGAPDAQRQRALESLFRAYQGDVPGASVVVLKDAHAVYARAFGQADLEGHIAATTATNYRLASMTKEFTAAAVLLLAQEGRLSLGDPISRWLPGLPPADAPITVRQLLTHTSGLIDYEELIPPGTTEQLHDADVLRLLQGQDRTYFPPGSAYRYSDSGYSLLSLIVARVSNGDFATFLRQRIFLPLNMRGSLAYEAGITTVPRRAYGYSLVAGHWTRTDQSLTSAVLGDGGVYSSVEDLARWDEALYSDVILKAATRAAAFSIATPTDDPNVGYGYGWRITGETVWHSGESIGFRNVIVRWPKRHFTVIILTNRDDPEPYTLALAVAKLWYPDADAVRAQAVVVGPDSGARPLPKN
ncbi:MAG TPA: serine hydrolase domain-containing protein [Steroidobacteraceae bacterium]|nr:serine hydrolase domain-containing protein [Steroidobacteraceae bacterium]